MNFQTLNPDSVINPNNLPDINSMVEGVRSQSPLNPNPSQGLSVYDKLSSISSPAIVGKPGDLDMVKHDVPISAIYSKLRDGSYHAKYKNYAGAFDNEDRLAREQGVLEKMGKGITRFGAKVGIYALDATVGTATGIIQAINDRSLSSLWDNDFSNKMDDWNTKLENTLPIFYTNEYASKNIIGQMFDSPMTFLFKDVADGLAFVGGALLPEALLAAATGGASLPTTVAKLGVRSGLKSAAKSSAKNLAEKEIRNAGTQLLRQSNLEKYLLQPAANMTKTGAFIARTSNFEAGMEARHNFYEALEKYHMDFEEIHGREPNMEEIKEFTELARSSANGVYAGNMAILSVSNVAMFGRTFGIDPFKVGQRLERSANKLIGLAPSGKIGAQTMKEATKLQKFTGRAYNFLNKPVIEGLWEEGMQGVAGETMQHYLESKYNPDFADSYGFTAALTDGFAHTYGTKEGWKEIGIGMIIGWLAPGLQGQGFAGIGKKGSYSGKRKAMEAAVAEANTAAEAFRNNVIAGMNNADAAIAFRERSARKQQEAEQDGTMPKNDDIDMAVITDQFFKSQSRFKTHSEIEAEFEAIVEKTELGQDIKDILSAEGISESDYKSAIIENFKQTGKDYLKAKSAIERLGLDGRIKFDEATMKALGLHTPEGQKANTGLIADYLMTALVVGSAARRSAIEIGKDIQAFTGKDGMADALAFYSALSDKKWSKIFELDEKRQELEKKKKLHVEVGLKISQLSGQRTRGTQTGTELETEFNTVAEQHTALSKQILDLKAEIKNLEEVAKKEYESVAMASGISEIESSGQFLNPTDFLEKIKELDEYIAQLRETGEYQKASSLEYLVQQYKEQMDAAREIDNFTLAMADANFFASKRGQGLLGSIIGTRYEMPEDLRKLIDENNEIFDKEFNKRGFSQEGRLNSAILEELINKSENLSERDKHKISAILRLELEVRQRTRTAQERLTLREEAAAETTTETPTEGDSLFPSDSVRTAVRKVIDEQQETTLDRYNKIIEELLDAVDKLRGQSKEEQRTKLQEQIQTLQEKKAELEEKLKKEQEVETPAPTKEVKIRVNLDKKIQEVREKLDKVRKDLTSAEDLTKTFEAFAEQANLELGEKAEEFLKSLAFYKDLISSKSKQKQARAKKVNEVVSELKESFKNDREHGNKVIDTLRKVQQTKEQLEQLERDLQNQINYYNNLKAEGKIDSLQDVEAKISSLNEKKSSLQKLIDKFKDLISIGKNILNELVDAVFAKQNSIETFLAFTGFQQKTSEQLREDIKNTDSVNDYGALNNEFIRLNNELEVSMDNVENQEGVIQVYQQTVDNLNNRITTIDNNIRYLEELKDTEELVEEEVVPDTPLSTTQTELDAVNQELERVEQALEQNQAVKIIDSADYLRLEELNKKRQEGELTLEETNELAQLEEDIDRWIDITGTVVDGFRLSDLIRLRSQLENTEILTPEQIAIMNALTILQTVNFNNNRSERSYYELTQTYGAVTAVTLQDKGETFVSIQGITLEELQAETGLEEIQTEDRFEKENKRGNIVLSQTEVDRINENSNIRILPKIEQLNTNYSFVVRVTRDGNIKPINSDFSLDFNESMNPNAVYDIEKGDNIELEIDPQDPHNQALIEDYKNAKTEEGKQKAIKAIKEGLVIRTIHGDNFVGVLKGVVEAKTEADLRFEAMRSGIVTEEFLQQISQSNEKISSNDAESGLPQLTASQVLPGFPNFRMKAVEGTTDTQINSMPFTAEDVKKVTDIGYIEAGKKPNYVTRSGTKDFKGVFTDKLAKEAKKGTKIPFVVIKRGKNSYAYPVELSQKKTHDNTEMRTTFENEMLTLSQKVEALNDMLAKRGIDIKESGNTFTHQNIQDSQFFDDMFARVENIEYFSGLEFWAGPKKDGRSIESILMDEAFIDIDLSNPFHSPKLQLDYSSLNIELDPSAVKNLQEQMKAKKETESKTVNKNLERLRNKKDENTCTP